MIDLVSILQNANVRPLRLFPLTDPAHWIAILDERGQELA